jgi:hypothetical protein
MGSIDVRIEADAVVLMLKAHGSTSSEWKSVEQRVPLVWTRVPPRRCTSLVAVQRLSAADTAGTRGEALSSRQCFRLPSMLRLGLGLPKPAGDPAPSRHQQSAKAKDAPWWERKSPRTIS